MRYATLLLLLAASAPAQTLWVDSTNGNDANPGTAALPLRSITRAVSMAGPTVEVRIRAGVYGPTATGEVLPISIGAVPQAGLVLHGQGAVVIDLAGMTNTAFTIDAQAPNARITNLTFFNSDTMGWWTRAIDTTGNASAVEIDRCTFHGLNRGIVIWGASNTITGMRIHDNLFYDMANDAINEFGAACQNELYHNTIVGTPAGVNLVGILTEGAGSVFTNNLITGMRDGFLTGAASTPGNFTGNDLWKNGRNWNGTINRAPAGNYSLDPQFAAAAQNDFRLSATSALIDSGAVAPFRADLDNIPGDVDGDADGSPGADIGAYEYSPVTHTVSSSAGGWTFRVDGPPTQVAVLVFAGGEGRLPLPGGSSALLDPFTLFPLVLSGAMPYALNVTLGPQPPGTLAVSEGLGLDPGSGRLTPGPAVTTEF